MKKNKSLGDCYEAAGKYIMSHPGENLTLVHAEVMGQGQLEGVTFGHAFVQDEHGNVIDVSNGRNIRMPAALYFALGSIHEINNFFAYDEKATLEKR